MATIAPGPILYRSLFTTSIVIGVVALTLGMVASESVSSDFSRLFTGHPTGRAIWLVIGGSITTVAGLIGLARGAR